MPRPAPAHPPRTDALLLLRALLTGLGASARAVERRTGITNAQLFLLQELAAAGPHSLGDLAGRAHTQPSTASLVVSRLQRAGLVTRRRATDDARRAVVAITAAGRRLVRRAPTAPTARLLQALERLDAREARALASSLRPLLRQLDLAYATPAMLFESPTTPSTARSSR